MTSMWQQTEEMAKKHDQGGSLWLRLAGDGDKAVVVFLGDPFPREVCFVNGKYLDYTDELKAAGQKPSLRVALDVALFDTKEVKVLEQGVVFFKDLVRVREKYGLDRWAFEIQRHGAAKDPKTTYSILPEHQLTTEQQKVFQGLPRHDLAKLYAGDPDEAGESGIGSYDQKAEGPIDPKVAQAIVGDLKMLPRAAVDRFLEKFGIQRVRDLPAASAAKAQAFVDQLRSELEPPDTEIDPFA